MIESWLMLVDVIVVSEALVCILITGAAGCHLSVSSLTADSDCDDCAVLVCTTDPVVTNLLIKSNTEY